MWNGQHSLEDLTSVIGSQDDSEELESRQLAEALAASENDWIQQQERSERHSQKVAESIHQRETSKADKEYAAALQQSTDHFHNDRINVSLVENHIIQADEINTGTWDCTKCSYKNDPYVQNCQMCMNKASESTLTFPPIPNLKFGLEIEIIIPNGRRDGFTLLSIATQLTRTGQMKVKFHENASSHVVSDHWKLVTDGSLQAISSSTDLCFELVSPVLQGEVGMHHLRAIVSSLRQLGIETDSSCSFHVHVDATKAQRSTDSPMGTLRGLKMMTQCFLALENAFDLLVGLAWDKTDFTRRANGNKYCRSNRLVSEFAEMSNRQRWDEIDGKRNFTDLVNLISPTRYHKLNLTNVINRNRPSTCEFRHHGGVEDVIEAEAWVRLVLQFCHRSSCVENYKNVKACLLPQKADPKDELRALFNLIDCDGLEQYFVVERRLFSDDRMRNNWTCTTCRRTFQESRALSQHCKATGHHFSSAMSKRDHRTNKGRYK